MPVLAPPRPAFPGLPLSAFDPFHVGMDELGADVLVDFNDRPGIVIGGEPGSGKSSIVNLVTAKGALSRDCKLILLDGKLVELWPWRGSADIFVGPSLADATAAFEHIQQEVINDRLKVLTGLGRRKVTKADGLPAWLIVIDEFALFSATLGTKAEREKFSALVRDVVARGRACGVWVILATQRPGHTIVDPALRDLFGYRCAFRCSTDASSDIILGHGRAAQGHNASLIDPMARGVAWLLAEDGFPRRIKAAYLDDDQVAALARRAALLRGAGND
jgi:S-DNA-T family DNA segregation ATPase FtsK/SpoIIIE